MSTPAGASPQASHTPAARSKSASGCVGADHPDTAADVAALAALLDGQGKYDEAEPLYRRALSVFERAYGPEHYEVAVNLNNLAALCHATGRAEEAEALYLRSLAIKEKLLGAQHPDVGVTLNNLAVFYKSRQRYAEAADSTAAPSPFSRGRSRRLTRSSRPAARTTSGCSAK